MSYSKLVNIPEKPPDFAQKAETNETDVGTDTEIGIDMVSFRLPTSTV